MRMLRLMQGLGLMVLLGTAVPAAAAPAVEVVGLFGDQALVRVDGEMHRLQPGESTPEGVELVRAGDGGARLRIDGRERFVRLGARLRPTGGDDPEAGAAPAVTIWRDRQGGMFRTIGTINGMPVNFLVDTGATHIAMNAAQARRLGIDFRVEGEPAQVKTATRRERAWQVRLDRVKVGEIVLHNISAFVFDGPEPQELLLGMSFLGRLEMRNQGNKLILRKMYP